MIDELIQQLQSPDPDQRRRAITALAETKDSAALQPLAAVYRGDPDPALRDLALKAGRYIRQHAKPAPDSSADSGPPADKDAPPRITARERETARKYLNTASGFYTQGDRPRAVENLGRALSLDPDLITDRFAINLITLATGRTVGNAVPLLTHPDRRAELIESMGGKTKLKRTQSHGEGAETATWDRVLLDFGLYWIVNAIVLTVIFVISLDSIREIIENMPRTTTNNIDWDVLWAASTAALILLSLIISLSNVVQLAMQGAAYHFTALYVLAGDGTLVYLYRRLVPFQTLVSLAFGAIFVVLAVSGSVTMTWFIFPLVMIGGSVVVVYLLINLIGDVYNFGLASGCGTILIGSILLGVLSYIANYLIFFVLLRLLGG